MKIIAKYGGNVTLTLYERGPEHVIILAGDEFKTIEHRLVLEYGILLYVLSFVHLWLLFNNIVYNPTHVQYVQYCMYNKYKRYRGNTCTYIVKL